MGIADMDFSVAPVITKALMDRMQHENWGYLDMGGRRQVVHRRHHQLEQEALRHDRQSRHCS